MTLVVAIPTRNAVLFGSDTQVSDQRTRTTHIKIKRLSDHCLWAAAGQVSVIQRLEEVLDRMDDTDKPLPELRLPIGLAVRDTIEGLLRTDFRAGLVANDVYALGNLHNATFMFCEHRDGESRILSMGTWGAGEWYTRAHAIGSAADFAVALTKNYAMRELSPDRAAILLMTTLEQAIETAQSGVNYPLDIWCVDATGAHQLGDDEMRALYAETARLRSAQRELLERWEITGGSLSAAIETLPPLPPGLPRRPKPLVPRDDP